MAVASSSTSAGAPKAGQSIGKYRLVRDLGARAPHVFAASVTSIIGDSELVVLEVVSNSEASKEEMETFARRARRLALVRHPNLARMREVLVLKDRVAIASDFVEGELYGDLLAVDAGKKLGLVERLRVLADVLSGLSSIHLAPELPSAGDKEGKPPMHGALDPNCIVVGTDGSSRLVHLLRSPAIAGKSHIEAPQYTAPELLLGDDTSGVRADLYAVGVLLWEALTARRLFEESDEKEVLARQLAGPLPLATVPDDAAWAKPLIEVAARALDVDPEKRHASAAELAGALRLAVQARLAPASRVGAAVASIAKEKIAARAAWKPEKKNGIAKSVRLGQAAPVKAVPKVEAKPVEKPEVKPGPKPEAKPEKAANVARTTSPDDLESTEKKPVPVISRSVKTQIGVPSLASPDDDVDETKRLAIDSIADDDLFADEEIEEVAAPPKMASKVPTKKSMPPPLRPKSIAPPVPAHAAPPPTATSSPSVVVTATPPPAVVTPPPAEISPSPEPAPAETIATIAPVVTPAAEMPSAPAARAVAAVDSKIEVIPPSEDPQKKKRRAIVIGVIGAAALLFLVGIVKHATRDDTSPTSSAAKTTTTAHATASTATAVPTETAAATAKATATTTTMATAEPTAFVAEPVPTKENDQAQGESTTPPSSNPVDTSGSHPSHTGVQSSHPATPPAKPHKRPPHSNYEPEGI